MCKGGKLEVQNGDAPISTHAGGGSRQCGKDPFWIERVGLIEISRIGLHEY